MRKCMSDNTLMHAVMVNDIAVGEISDDELNEIQSMCWVDKRIYAKQAINVLWVVTKGLGTLVLTLPVAVFWLFVAVAVSNPEAVADFIAHVQKTPIQTVITNGLDILLTFWFLGWTLQCVILKRVPGYTNEFREATHTQIRRKLGIHFFHKISLVPIS
jgi:hypothetical protein